MTETPVIIGIQGAVASLPRTGNSPRLCRVRCRTSGEKSPTLDLVLSEDALSALSAELSSLVQGHEYR